ncbi:hypothetical protein FDI41_gp23 [Arthrobacter phage Piccoletto]|uniref:Uncharacterized protein n=4 Tax=Jawnskivirus TaxID=3425003 RepID=A0A222Z2E3_9CAUD|nr:hypothetical protein FDH47_gp23 [Arthrobacter phage Brent]YP_009609964.1 hypothetical protein FDI26_gp23 [Arthrobacter phage Beans]YP_009612402.1 hypothetical protein FDI41_gp23 [Arthrobacter phage Piccoletto]ASR78127.1 hypothetical protein SEA_FRANZY_23 [Arthrobacter phage Franzy]UVK62275.1 hypothetical protein SEA_NATHANVAAG_23 [Arthrobacter phage NathanVaag]ALF01234.1 hypothetical protein SEA_BRENT_23 [Arthrobacter phage Brent]ASR80654.1 hypothetical protein SEA_PICCOLETTO_23 [Arthrobac
MLSDIPAWVGTDLTPWAIVGLVVVSILTGRFLVPKIYYNEIKAERDRWRNTAESLTGSVGMISTALPEILEVGKSMDKVMTSVKEKTDAEIGVGE